MKIAVATICPHVHFRQQWWSYAPFVLEMDIWGDLFDELVMVAPLDEGPPPPFWRPYRDSRKVTIIPYRKNRGSGFSQARTAIWEIPLMIWSIIRASRKVDAFHVRCPGSIGLLSSLLVPLLRRRVCAKYAGQWNTYRGEPRHYRLQKAILRSFWWRGPVTIYGENADRSCHIIPFFTSVMTSDQMERARVVSRRRKFSLPLRVLYVGRLSKAKNVDVLISAIGILKEQGVRLECSIVGDGTERGKLEEQVSRLDLEDAVTFTGSVDFEKVFDFYEKSDVLVLASETEGWPKAIAEGMAFGLICVGSNRGLVPWMLGKGRGLVVPPGDANALAGVLREIATCPEKYEETRTRASQWAQKFTIDHLRIALGELMTAHWGVPIGIRREQEVGFFEGKPPSNHRKKALLDPVHAEVPGRAASTQH